MRDGHGPAHSHWPGVPKIPAYFSGATLTYLISPSRH
jgi:hypothetical protein